MQNDFVKLFNTSALTYFDRLLYTYAACYCADGKTIPAAPAFVRALFFPYDSISLRRISLSVERLISGGFFALENGRLSPALPDEKFLFFSACEKREDKRKATKETERKEAKERIKKITEKKKERETSHPLSPQKKENPEENFGEQAGYFAELESLGVKNAGYAEGIDYPVLIEKIRKSRYLSAGKPFAWIVDHYADIIADKYENFAPIKQDLPARRAVSSTHFANERHYTKEQLDGIITDVDDLEI